MNDNFDLYSKQVMKYFTNPKNIGIIKDADGVGTVGNPRCGDVMKVYIKIGKRPILMSNQLSVTSDQGEQNKKTRSPVTGHRSLTEEFIKDIKVQTLGCGAAIATSSIATEMVKGKNLDQALKITNQEVAKALGGLPPVKMHCSLLAEEGIKKAIENYYEKRKTKN